MKNYPKYIKNTLHSVIRDMAKHPENFCRSLEKDFTRKRKLPFEKVLTLLIKMGGHSLREEMLDCLDFKEMPASVSALVQQRSKILPEALEYGTKGVSLIDLSLPNQKYVGIGVPEQVVHSIQMKHITRGLPIDSRKVGIRMTSTS